MLFLDMGNMNPVSRLERINLGQTHRIYEDWNPFDQDRALQLSDVPWFKLVPEIDILLEGP